MGRTARAGKAGRSLLFLLPSELGFLRFLKVAKVPLNEYSFPNEKIANVQGQVGSPRLSEITSRQLADQLARLCSLPVAFLRSPQQLEKLISKNYYLHQSARDGFRAYIQSYASYSLKSIFDVSALDLAKVGKAFGFAVPPSVNINIGSGLKGKKRKVDGRGSDIEAESGDESSGEEEDALDGRRNKAAMVRRGGKGLDKRKEVMGAKKTEKDFYREGRERQAKASEGKQWSR